MKAVMRELAQAKRHYSKLPLFEFLRSESIRRATVWRSIPAWRHSSWRSRISTVSCCAMKDSKDPHQLLINEHTYEDDHHWPWYLEDFTKLGFDRTASVTQTLRSYMKDDAQQNRMLGSRLAQLLYGTTPTEKLVIVEAIEETGNVLFGLTAKIAARIQAEGGPELRYLGQFHSAARPATRCTEPTIACSKPSRSPSSNACAASISRSACSTCSPTGPPNYWRTPRTRSRTAPCRMSSRRESTGARA